MSDIDLVVIGGTGLYELAALGDDHAEPELLEFETPFGPGSAPFHIGQWADRRVAFLARHGLDHSLAPHEVNYKANILACSELKPKAVIAVNAVGSINAAMPPAALVLPDQIIDYTYGREHTFSGNIGDQPLHVDFTEPYASELRRQLIQADHSNVLVAASATYAATQGPRLETAAEVQRLRRDGCDIVGMTGMPEAGLARELELNFASVCLVANWAAGFPRPGQAPIAMPDILANINTASNRLMPLLESILLEL